MTKLRSPFILSVFTLAALGGCSLQKLDPINYGDGGSAGDAGGGSAGEDTATGGKSATGGRTSKGGTSAEGGTSSKSSTAAAGGGNGEVGGTSTASGGASATGGASAVTSGTSATGGTSANGGTTATGGTTAATGGKSATGGTSATGGVGATGGTSATGGASSTLPAPVITSFGVDYNKVCSGSVATITAVFANGTGVIDNGVGTVTSGQEKATAAITADTTYTLTVTNSVGVSTKSQAIVVKALPRGDFTPTGNMNTVPYAHATTVLSDGRVLVVGGDSSGAAELYDLNSGSFTNVSSGPGQGILWAVARPKVLALPSMKALVTSDRYAWVFDVNSSTYFATAVDQFSEWRTGHSATWLPTSGKAFIAGGCDRSPWPQNTTVLFNSASVLASAASWGPNLTAARSLHTATLLPNTGKILIAGGTLACDDSEWESVATAEIYDPTSGAVGATTATDSLIASRAHASAVALASGKVLIVGGTQSYNYAALSSAEIFDPGAGPNGQFSTTGALAYPRFEPSLVLLRSGNVLVVGGSPWAELYSPNSDRFTTIGNMVAVSNAEATLLPNGMVLLTSESNSKYAYLYCE